MLGKNESEKKETKAEDIGSRLIRGRLRRKEIKKLKETILIQGIEQAGKKQE
jgi:hypothetical protein